MLAVEALQMMARQDINKLPVITNGRAEVIVTRATLLEVLTAHATPDLPQTLPHVA